VKTPLAPYRDILTELKFEIAWSATLPHLTRERYEREEVGEGDTRGVLWVFLEANEAEVLWTMGIVLQFHRARLGVTKGPSSSSRRFAGWISEKTAHPAVAAL
jgi:hypothetical protein